MAANVGLSTPRGSGTSGYVQRNLSALKPRQQHQHPSAPGQPYSKDLDSLRKYKQRVPDPEILEHDRRREIEVKVFELRDRLEDEGELDDDEIEDRCDALRKKLEEDRKKADSKNGGGNRAGGSEGSKSGSGRRDVRGLKAHQVHELAEAKIEESERLRKALGIREDYEEGSHWKRQEEQRLKEGLVKEEKEDDDVKKEWMR